MAVSPVLAFIEIVSNQQLKNDARPVAAVNDSKSSRRVSSCDSNNSVVANERQMTWTHVAWNVFAALPDLDGVVSLKLEVNYRLSEFEYRTFS